MRIAASRLERLVNCGGSFEMEEPIAAQPQTADQMEGDAAHEAAFLILSNQVQLAEELVDRRMSNGVYVTPEMIDNLEEYVTHCTGWTGFETEVNATIEYENTHTITGRCDAFNVTVDTVQIADFKYGWRVVEAYPNLQLIAYAIGFRQMFPHAEHFELTIAQPRPFHRNGTLRTHTMTAAQVDDYAHRFGQIFDGRDANTLKTGPHCRYCRAKPVCAAVTTAAYNAVDVAHTTATDDMPTDALSQVVTDLRRAKELIEEKLNVCEDQAISKIGAGEYVPGYAVKPSLGNYVWNDGITAEIIHAATGVEPTKPQLMTPAQLKKKGAPADVVAALTFRPNRGFKLVPQSGADAAFNTAKKG